MHTKRLPGAYAAESIDWLSPIFDTSYGCLGSAVVERWTRDRKVAGSTPGRGAIKSTKSTQPSIHPSGVGKSSTGLHGWG